jgi:hypothetical protein
VIYPARSFLFTGRGAALNGTMVFNELHPVQQKPLKSCLSFCLCDQKHHEYPTGKDPARGLRYLSEWFHGFTRANLEQDFASYSFEPNADVPVRIIVLDNTQFTSDPDIHGYGHGTLDEQRYNWLVSELDKGQTENRLIIIAPHMPIGDEPAGSYNAELVIQLSPEMRLELQNQVTGSQQL